MSSENTNESSSSTSDLSPERSETLLHFQEIAAGVERSKAIEFLNDAEWNLERAVLSYMGISDSPRRTDRSFGIPNIDLTPPNQRIVHSSIGQSWFIYGLKFLLFPITLSYRFFFSLTRILFSFLHSDPRTNVTDPIGDVKKFIDFFKITYCSDDEGKLPPFYSGSYSQALNEAKQSLRYLIVYLHGETHEDTEHFCKKTLCDSRVLEYLRNYSEIVMWGCDVDSPEGYRVSRVLRENTYPFIGIIGLSLPSFSPSKVMALFGRIEGLQTPDALVSQISNIISENCGITQAARIDREEIRVNAEIRKEQDQAYEMSLAVDRAKKLEKMAKDNELFQQKKEEEDRKQKEENLCIARKLRSQKWKRIISHYKPSSDERVRLSIKLPSSHRITKEFDLDDSVELIYYTIIAESEDLVNFSVKSNFPQREINCEPSGGSDVEDYLDLVGSNEDEIDKKIELMAAHSKDWKPNENVKSFRENQLFKPEILLVIDNDA